MGSSCFGLYWDGRADSECREGKGCTAMNECCAAFCTGVLAKHQRSIGPKKATPEVLGELTSTDPKSVLLAMNWQKNTGFNPYVVEKEQVKATRTVIEYAGEETELDDGEDLAEDFDPEMFEEVSEGELNEAELRAAQTVEVPKQKKASRRKEAQEKGGNAAIGTQFCEKCKGTGKRGRGVCKSCSGTGQAQGETQPLADKITTAKTEVDARAETKPASSHVAPRHEIETPMAGGNSRGDSGSRVLQVQGGAVPHAVFSGGGNSGGAGLPETVRSSGQVSRGQKAGRHAKTDVVECSEVFQTSLANSGGKGSIKKPQVVLDTYNKRIVGVDWPDCPSLMETPEVKIVQIIAWDVDRNGFVKYVSQLSGDPNERLFKSLC